MERNLGPALFVRRKKPFRSKRSKEKRDQHNCPAKNGFKHNPTQILNTLELSNKKKGKRGKTRKNQGRLCDVFSCIGVYLIRMASMYCYEIWLSDRLMLYIVQCGPSMTSWSIYILSLFWSIYMYHFWPYQAIKGQNYKKGIH